MAAILGRSSNSSVARAVVAAKATHRIGGEDMAKEELLEFNGTVTEVLPDMYARITWSWRSRPTISPAAASIFATRTKARAPPRHAVPISGGRERSAVL